MLRNKIRVHLNMREALGVPGEMNFKISFGCESVSADVTLVGPFTGVRSKGNKIRFKKI